MATCQNDGGDEDCPAARMWFDACAELNAVDAEGAWREVVAASPPDGIWHSLRNCVAYQARVWRGLVSGGCEVLQPAAFSLALVLRHTPPPRAAALLPRLLSHHRHHQDLTSYILALLTEAELPQSSPGAAPHRDLRLYGDCELAALAAPPPLYDVQARLVRAEYAGMAAGEYAKLRVKILNQLTMIPKLFCTPEFESLEASARENIEREIRSLKENAAEP